MITESELDEIEKKFNYDEVDRLISEIRKLRDGLNLRDILSEAWVGKKINAEYKQLLSLLRRNDEMLHKFKLANWGKFSEIMDEIDQLQDDNSKWLGESNGD